MAPEPKKEPRSAGSLLAVSIIAGAIGGSVAGQPSIGFAVGLAAGLVILGIVWLLDRRTGE